VQLSKAWEKVPSQKVSGHSSHKASEGWGPEYGGEFNDPL